MGELRTVRHPFAAGLALVVAASCGSGDAVAADPPSHVVRLGYVVPTNRSAQPGGVEDLGTAMTHVRDWFAEQMDRYGFGPKTFRLETGTGSTPQVHVAGTPVSDAEIRSDTWGKTIAAAANAGLPIWSSRQVWLLVPETHVQQPHGAVEGGVALGASFGSGSDPGVAMVGGDMLARLNPTNLTDTRRYAGLTLPRIGPHPLAQDVSFPWFEGNTVSSVSSSAVGALAHELGHAFGLPHDVRNDSNFRGNLMANGLRGWRGSVHPDAFPQDDVQLSYAAALTLNVSRYFNTEQTFTDQTKPILSIQTAGTVAPESGKLTVRFGASDAGGLAAAFLRRNGETIAEMLLTGTSATTAFSTPFYTKGKQDEYSIAVYDAQGNVHSTSVNITPLSGFNQAPTPFVKLFGSLADVGESITLDASASTDSDGSSSLLTVEWDLNGDGIFDTLPSVDKSLSVAFDGVGTRLISARLTDTAGDWSISTPLALRVVPEPAATAFAGIGLAAALCRRPRRRPRRGNSSAATDRTMQRRCATTAPARPLLCSLILVTVPAIWRQIQFKRKPLTRSTVAGTGTTAATLPRPTTTPSEAFSPPSTTTSSCSSRRTTPLRQQYSIFIPPRVPDSAVRPISSMT